MNVMENKKEKDPNGIGQHDPGAKLDSGKPDMTYLQYFPKALREVCKVCMKGAKKYSRGGWRSVSNGANRYYAAIGRHYLPEKPGEEIDEDTGCLHRAQVAWNALASLELWLEQNDTKNNK